MHSPSFLTDGAPAPTVDASKAAFERAGLGPDDVDVVQASGDTDAGAEIIHMAETGLCADGEQEKLIADGATEIGGAPPCRTPTVVSSPTANRSVRLAYAKFVSSCCSYGAPQVTGKFPGRPTWVSPSCSAHPAPRA